MPYTSFANPLALSVTSAFNEPVAGGLVVFTTPSAGAGAALSVNPATINATGQASVTATANGVLGAYQITAAANGGNAVNFNLSNICQAISVALPLVNTGTAGQFFSQDFAQMGSVGTFSFGLNSGTLPQGLMLSTNGTLSGTPTQTGSFPITVKVTDSNNCTGVSLTYTLVIGCPTISVTPPVATTSIAGQPFNQSFMQSGGVGKVSFALNSGGLPQGQAGGQRHAQRHADTNRQFPHHSQGHRQ